MSYSRPSCIWEFTPRQITRLLDTLRNNDDRKKLITNGVRYVSSTASDSNSSCTYDSPCKTVGKAVAASSSGYRIYLKPGAYQSANINDKPLSYNRWGFTGAVQLVP
jgi:hypothetical protein